MYIDTEIQVLYRRADDLSKAGNYKESLNFMEKMKEKFEKLNDSQKDKHLRQKLRKCTYTLNTIIKSGRQDLKSRALVVLDWIGSESYS